MSVVSLSDQWSEIAISVGARRNGLACCRQALSANKGREKRGERNLGRKLPPSVEDWSSDQRERCTEVRELYGTMYLSNGNDAEVRDPHRLPKEGLPILAYQLR